MQIGVSAAVLCDIKIWKKNWLMDIKQQKQTLNKNNDLNKCRFKMLQE